MYFGDILHGTACCQSLFFLRIFRSFLHANHSCVIPEVATSCLRATDSSAPVQFVFVYDCEVEGKTLAINHHSPTRV